MTRKVLFFLFYFASVAFLGAVNRPNYWQQAISYEMDVSLDVKSHLMEGKQKIVYTNNSPDTLKNVFFHLYFNAFQPNSGMDYQSRNFPDPDMRVGSRIQALKQNEMGFCQITKFQYKGKSVPVKSVGTILEVALPKPILPGETVDFYTEFLAQVPIQIRRNGRDSEDGISYSMAQWYPKMAEYDANGWHAHPYLGREFHGVFGDFTVRITLDEKYLIAATGVLQNKSSIGAGYVPESEMVATPFPKGKKVWEFKAEKVHDFAWAADPDYTHDIIQVPNGPEVHFVYQHTANVDNWKKLQGYIAPFFIEMEKWFGKYPYPVFYFVEGGDGGMEYPMLTLITNRGNLEGLVSVSYHEAIHNWFYGVLATNEALYPWMDEGFTHYATELMMALLYHDKGVSNLQEKNYASYLQLLKSSERKPLSTHSDWYQRNRHYSISAYSAGAVFLHQLRYIVGEPAWRKGMLRYFEEWKFKHPEPIDFIRCMEQSSGIQLWWYLNQFVHSLNVIDYTVNVNEKKGGTSIVLTRRGDFPMPIDLIITFQDGKQKGYTIPLEIMRGSKKDKWENIVFETCEPWQWVFREYVLDINIPTAFIKSVAIDGSGRLANVNSNSVWTAVNTKEK